MSEKPSKEIRLLWKESLNIQNSLSKKSSGNEQEVKVDQSSLRERLQLILEQILINDLDFAVHKGAAQLLWNTLFYAQIEEFRVVSRKLNVQKEKQKLQDITTAFKTFLAESSRYFEKLYERLWNKYCSDRPTEKKDESREEKIALMLQKIMIFLGDIARYITIYETGEKKNWSIARNYYLKAVILCPNNGKARNQLAVLATCQQNDFEAFYQYFRALTSRHPCSSSKENLLLLFERHRQKFVTSKQKMERLFSECTCEQESARPSVKIPTNYVTSSIIYLQGILYTKIGMEKFSEASAFCLSLFSACLHELVVEQHLLLKILVSCICGIHFATASDRSSVLPAACDLAFKLFVKMVSSLNHENANFFLGPVSVFLQCIYKMKASVSLTEDVLKGIIHVIQFVPQVKQSDLRRIQTPEDTEVCGLPFCEGFSPCTFNELSTVEKHPGDVELFNERGFRIAHIVALFLEDESLVYDNSSGIYVINSTKQGDTVNYEGFSFYTPKIQKTVVEPPSADAVEGERIVFRGFDESMFLLPTDSTASAVDEKCPIAVADAPATHELKQIPSQEDTSALELTHFSSDSGLLAGFPMASQPTTSSPSSLSDHPFDFADMIKCMDPLLSYSPMEEPMDDSIFQPQGGAMDWLSSFSEPTPGSEVPNLLASLEITKDLTPSVTSALTNVNASIKLEETRNTTSHRVGKHSNSTSSWQNYDPESASNRTAEPPRRANTSKSPGNYSATISHPSESTSKKHSRQNSRRTNSSLASPTPTTSSSSFSITTTTTTTATTSKGSSKDMGEQRSERRSWHRKQQQQQQQQLTGSSELGASSTARKQSQPSSSTSSSPPPPPKHWTYWDT